MNENLIINSFFKKGNAPVNDCCLLDEKYLITTDSMSEDTHFKLNWSTPEQLATKLIEVNVSDIAVGGGIPTHAFLNLGLSKISSKNNWIKRFSTQFKKRLKIHSIELSGGDTYNSKITNLTLTLVGKTFKPIFRNGGRKNDILYMTGSVGLSTIGYKILMRKISSLSPISHIALKRHLSPISNLEVMKNILTYYKVNAAMDITDGLVQDSEKLAKASSLNFKINIDRLPYLDVYRKYADISDIITSGEELEILFLSPDIICMEDITQIGEATTGKGKVDFFYKGRKFVPNNKGFVHFL